MTQPVRTEAPSPTPPSQELRRATLPDGGLRGAISGLIFGSACVGGGLLFLSSALLSHPSGLMGWLCPLASIVFGALYFPSCLPRALAYVRFGCSRAEISPVLIRPGSSFTFRYGQWLRLPVRASLALSLVLREVIITQSGDSESKEQVDHLVQSFEQPAVDSPARVWLDCTQEFSVPAKGNGEFNTGDNQTVWLVKVRLLPRQGLDLWLEFELPFFEDRATSGGVSALTEPDESYSLVLMKNRWPATAAFTQAIQVVAPHLTTYQVGAAALSTPVELVSNLSREHAEQARARLEGVGAVVEVRRGREVIPAPPGQRFPIPHSNPANADASLPLPFEPGSSDD